MVSGFLQVFPAVPTRDEANRLARLLVDSHATACVQIMGPIRSVYRWHGDVEAAEEWLLPAKTSTEQLSEVERLILEIHSYDTPEIAAVPIVSGTECYLTWLASALAGDETPGEQD